MKNKEFYKLLKIKKNKFNTNSGFTLTELLVGLFMSIFVIGALGFGLVTVLSTTQSENSKVKARTENSRALDFISDEVRQAKNIETDAANAGTAFNSTGKTIVFALDIPEITSTTTVGTRGRIVYYLQSNDNGNWKGPQVLYRWGPPLDANGNYTPVDANGNFTNASAWQYEALIDGIGINEEDDTKVVSSPCTTGTVTPTNPKGFYACLSLQDSTKSYEPDITSKDYNPRNTAQLYLTGQTKTASGVNNDSQTNNTQVVARARKTLASKTDENKSVTWSVEGLGGDYKCKDVAGGTPDMWSMRTDFSNSASPTTDPDKVSWTQDPTSTTQAQPQPIEIKSDKPLTITSNPINGTGCNSSQDPVPHTINFGKPKTFNGVCDSTLETGGSCPSDAHPEQVTDASGQSHQETVQFFKQGSSVPNYGSNELGQKTLGRFLYDKGWAIIDLANNTTTGTQAEILNNRNTKFKIPTSVAEINTYVDSLSLTASEETAQKARLKLLGEDQRIVGFEIGVHASTTEPGFDLQDNIFIVTSDVFEKKFAPSCFSGTACSAATGRPTPT